MEEKHYNILLQSFMASWAAGDDAYPDRIVHSFRQGLPKFEQYYCPVPEEVILDIIRTKFPDYGKEDDLGPRVKPTTPQIPPEPSLIEQQPAPKIETSSANTTLTSWAEAVIAEELPEPKPQRKPKAFNKQTHEKKQWKLDLVAFFNRSKLNRRTGFTADSLRSQMTTLITTRTMYNYLEELFKEGEIKRWRQPREAGEKIAYRHWYSSLDNPDPKYVRWIEIG